MKSALPKGALKAKSAANLLWAAAIFDAIFVYFFLQLLGELVLAVLSEAQIATFDFKADILDGATQFAIGLATYLGLLLIYWLICETILGGRTLGRACLMLEIRQKSGERPTFAQLTRRAAHKIGTLGLSGLSARKADSHDARQGLVWWSPMGASNLSPFRNWTLRIESGAYAGTTHSLERLPNFLAHRVIQIGRDTSWADVSLDRDERVSSRHAVLRYAHGRWMLREAGKSSNRTFLNGKPIDPDQWYRVEVPLEFRVANVRLSLTR